MAHKNRIAELCLAAAVAIFLVTSCVLPAFAAGPTLDRLCSATFTMEYDHEPLPGGKLCMYRIAVWEFRENSYGFVWAPELADSGLDLSEKHTDLFARRAAMLVESRSLKGYEEPIDEKGIAKFKDIPCGLYVVYQTEPAPGFEAISPFCVSLPYASDGQLAYDVYGAPKPRPEKTTEPTHPTDPTNPTDPTIPTWHSVPDTSPYPTKPTTMPSGATTPHSVTTPSVTPPRETKPGTTAVREEVTTAPAETTERAEEPEKLPQTGQLWWPVFVMGFCGAAFFGVGLALRILFRHGTEDVGK